MNPIRRKTSEGGASATAARRRVRRPAVAVAALALGVASAPLQATTVADPSGDFLATYVGPKNADLDIVKSTATFDGTTFRLSTTVAGSVGNTPGVFYAWGINRGAGTALFATGSPVIGSTVLFDTIAVMLADGSGRIVTFPTPNVFEDFFVTPVPGAATISGDTITGLFPASLLPSSGFAVADYTFTNWTRLFGLTPEGNMNLEVADFSPDTSSITASVPEPQTYALVLAGLTVLGAGARRRRRAQ